MPRRLLIFRVGILAFAFTSARAHAAPPAPASVGFSNVGASSMVVTFQATTGTTIQFLVEISSGGFSLITDTTTVLNSTFTGLDVNTEFFARVTAEDTVDGSSTTSSSVSTFTLANPPLSLATTTVPSGEVGLTWDE